MKLMVVLWLVLVFIILKRLYQWKLKCFCTTLLQWSRYRAKAVNDACEKLIKKGYRSAFVLTVKAAKYFQSNVVLLPLNLMNYQRSVS